MGQVQFVNVTLVVLQAQLHLLVPHVPKIYVSEQDRAAVVSVMMDNHLSVMVNSASACRI